MEECDCHSNENSPSSFSSQIVQEMKVFDYEKLKTKLSVKNKTEALNVVQSSPPPLGVNKTLSNSKHLEPLRSLQEPYPSSENSLNQFVNNIANKRQAGYWSNTNIETELGYMP